MDQIEQFSTLMDEVTDGLFMDETMTLAAKIPSIDAISRGIHIFNGDSFGTRPIDSAWDFTYNKGKETSSIVWSVPDQIVGIPTLAVQCASASDVSEMFESNSMETIESQSTDMKTGYKREVDVTGEVPVGPAKVGASTTLTTSLQFGASNTQRNEERSMHEGYSYSMSRQDRSKMMEVQMNGYSTPNQRFLKAYQSLASEPQVFEFAKRFGTHWIEKATFGATFDKTININSEKNAESAQKFHSNTVSAGFEVWGFGASAEHTQSKLTNIQKQSNVKAIKVTNTNVGSIDFQGLPACKNMGSLNAPVMVDQQIRPYWVLPAVQQFQGQTRWLKQFNAKVFDAANRCRKTHCGVYGDCRPNKEAWGSYAQFAGYDNFFIQDANMCLKNSRFYEDLKKEKEKVNLCVHLWEHDFGGEKKTFCLDPHDESNNWFTELDPLYFNDKLSSFDVAENAILTIYEHSNGRGWPGSYVGPGTWKMGTFPNDMATSIRVSDKRKAACFFEHTDQNGGSDCFTYNERTGVGEYTDIGINGHCFFDRISSLTVPAGVQVKAYQHPGFGGAFDTYTGPNKFNARMNDQYSSLKICRGNCP